MKRIFFTAVFLALAALPARADDGPSMTIPPGGTLRGAFQEDHYNLKNSKPLHTEGHFVVAPGQGIIWKIEKPIPYSFVVTSNGVMQMLGTMPLMHIPVSRMPMVAEATPLIAATLSGNWNALENEFVVKRKATANRWDATVTPREGSRMPFQSISFAGNKQVDYARAMRASGGFDKFTFSDQKVSHEGPTAAEMNLFAVADQGGMPASAPGTSAKGVARPGVATSR